MLLNGIPTPSAIPKAIREAIKIEIEEAKIGVKNVSNDHNNTANVNTFLPPNLLENVPPMI